MTSVCRQLVLAVGFTLAVLALCGRGEAETAEERWYSRDRGRVVFAGVVGPASVFRDSIAVCVLHLPACSLEVYPFYSNRPHLIPPAWGRDGQCLYYGTDSGIVRHNLRAGTAEVVLSEEMHTHQGSTELTTVVYGAEKVRQHHPPGIGIEAMAHCVATSVESHYYWIVYSVDAGPPRWRVSPDSLDLPRWVDQRVRERFSGDLKPWYDSLVSDTVGTVTQDRPALQGEPTEQGWSLQGLTPLDIGRTWFDLVWQDSLRNLSLVLSWDLDEVIPFGLTATSQGDLMATWQSFHDRPNGALIYDLTSGESIVPEFPGKPRAASLKFSPDGDLLAAAVHEGSQPGIYICSAPDYWTFERLDVLLVERPADLCWSPDGEWLLVLGRSNREMRLVAVELETLAEVEIPWPFYENGKPARWHHSPGLDWIE